MKINFIDKFLGSGFFTGYIPFASGTFGSLAALIIYIAIPGFENAYVIIPLIFLSTIYGIYVGSKFEKVYGKDPAECTIDEVIGMWISLIYLPKSFAIYVTAFFIWRIIDIIKIFPIRKLEKLDGGLGIVADDVLGGIYSLIIIHLILYLIKNL